jgi:uncharacterized membrane protein
MLGYDVVRLHAALNDLPTALLVAAVLFEFGSLAFKRESLAWAAIWCLWAGTVGGWAAIVAGNLAEEDIDHGEAIHELMERHESLGLIVMGVFTAILLWKLWRRTGRSRAEDWVLRTMSVLGLAGLFNVAIIGGRMVFDHAAGVPNTKMIEELKDRDAMPFVADTARVAEPSSHMHAPGTPPHEH